MSADRHPSRYRPPFVVERPLHPVHAEALAEHEAPHLIAGIEFLLGLTSPTVQAPWCAQAPYREP